jgi:hypothetical protein
MAITSQAMPPNRRTPTPAQGRGDDQGLGPCGVDGKVEMPSGEVTGSGEVAGDAPSAPNGTAGGKGELPEERLGRTIDVGGVGAGTVGVGLGAAVGEGGATDAVGVGVGRGDISVDRTAVGVGRAVVGVGKTSVGVGRTSVGVGRTSVGVGGTGVGEAGSGEVESGDWNQAPSAGPPSTARSSRVSNKSSTICTTDLRFDTFALDCTSALDHAMSAQNGRQ